MKTTIQNYSVVAKGEYSYKQTNEFLHIERFLIVRNRKHRFLLLDMNNLAADKLTAVKLQVEQFDSRGNYLGEHSEEFKTFPLGRKFLLKKGIVLERNCVDVRVKIVYAEYGNYLYRLGDNGVYVTYEQREKRKKLGELVVQAKTGAEGRISAF